MARELYGARTLWRPLFPAGRFLLAGQPRFIIRVMIHDHTRFIIRVNDEFILYLLVFICIYSIFFFIYFEFFRTYCAFITHFLRISFEFITHFLRISFAFITHFLHIPFAFLHVLHIKKSPHYRGPLI